MKRRSESHAWVKCKTDFNFDVRNLARQRSGKRGLRANISSLLLLALRPDLSRRKARGKIFSRIFVPISAASLVFGISFIIGNSSTSAASITLTVPASPLSVDIGPNDALGKSDLATVSVKTDSLAGYRLTISSKSGDNKLKGESNELVSIPEKLTEKEFTDNAKYINNWGYKVSKLDGEDNDFYVPGPTASLSVINTTKGKNIEADQYSFAIAAKADSSTQNGTYSNTFVLCGEGNGNDYSITYDLGEGGTGGPSPNPQEGNVEGKSVTLSSEVPTKETEDGSFEFKGWCSVPVTYNNTDNPTCKGGLYQPGNELAICDGGNTIPHHFHFV